MSLQPRIDDNAGQILDVRAEPFVSFVVFVVQIFPARRINL